MPLVSPQDILSLGFGEQIVMVQNSLHTPVKARSAFWDKLVRLAGRAGQ
jgi:type IV secretory pathway TraG/TraD family ATPase VirD4